MAVQRFLYPQRKRFETLSAMYAAGFGIFIWSQSFTQNPLEWADLDLVGALAFGQAMTIAALVHAAGVSINGSWRWSPVLRLIGMALHAGLFGYLAAHGSGGTAVYTYSWGFLMMAYGAASAARDVITAARGAEWSLQ